MPHDKQWMLKDEILRIIREEANYRPIVPFLGAGISVSAGFPTIKFVIQYLAKVEFAIQHGVFADRFPYIRDDQQAVETYRRHPSKYLEDFGWPNFGQLNADIWEWLARTDDINKGEADGLGRKEIWKESNRTIQDAKESYDKNKHKRRTTLLDLLAYDVCNDIKDIEKKINPLELRDHQQAIVQWILRKELTGRENGTNPALLKEWLQWKQHYFSNEPNPESEPDLLYGDWEMLLDRLCEGNSNLADALFTSFENGLNPTISHRYLAFLQPKLGIPLLLTTNFDSLLESAFHREGIPLKVFDVHKDAELPNPALASRQLSLLKLHGSAYGLRFGERLKHTLETDARNSVLGYIQKDALVLVMGFNGSERRIMQMLQAFVMTGEHGAGKPRLIWIQGPSEPGPLFNELVADAGDRVRWVQVSHIDTFLQELYFYITCNSYQASARNYSTIPNRPLTTGLEIIPANTKQEKRCPVHLCIADLKGDKPSSSWSSLAGMAFVNSLDNGYTVIWINLENHHTVEGIIADFFKRVRVVDPQAPSCAITNMDADAKSTKTAISKAVDRILDVFKRGRYILVLDSVESFGRPQMVHHGILSSHKNERSEVHHKNLWRFLKELLYIGGRRNPKPPAPLNHYWDSYVVVTVDEPRFRHLMPIDKLNLKHLESKLYKYAYLLVKSLQRIAEVTKINHIYIHHQNNRGYANLISCENLIPTVPDSSSPINPSAHWRYNKANRAENNSLERAKNVLSLLAALRSEDDNEESKFVKLRKKRGSSRFRGVASICSIMIFVCQ